MKASKTERPVRRGAAFVAVKPDGAVLLNRRAESGLLGGMAEVPCSPWLAGIGGCPGSDEAPFAADWQRVGKVVHVFTHFRLELAVYRADVTAARAAPGGMWWAEAATLAEEALPSVMKKAIEAAVPNATRRTSRRRAA